MQLNGQVRMDIWKIVQELLKDNRVDPSANIQYMQFERQSDIWTFGRHVKALLKDKSGFRILSANDISKCNGHVEHEVLDSTTKMIIEDQITVILVIGGRSDGHCGSLKRIK